MAFNGTRELQAGRAGHVPRVDRRALRPARQRLDVVRRNRSTCSTCRPIKPGYVDRGLLALHDFAAGMSLLPDEVEKERGVVIEEWRGRLGAGSRLTDKQLPVLLPGIALRRAAADRHCPRCSRSLPRERLLDFYQKWYRPDQMAVVVVGDIDPSPRRRSWCEQRFGGIPARERRRSATVDTQRAGAQGDAVQHVDRSGGAGLVGVARRSSGTAEARATRSATIARRSSEQLVAQMLNLRLREIARRPERAVPRRRRRARRHSAARSSCSSSSAAVPEGGIAAGPRGADARSQAHAAVRLQRRRSSTAPRRALLAGYERAYKERDTTESPSYAERVRARTSSSRNRFPASSSSTGSPSTLLPTVTARRSHGRSAQGCITDDNRVVLGVAPEKKDVPRADRRQRCARRWRAASAAPVERVGRRDWPGATLVEKPPAPGKVTARRDRAGDRRDRADAVERRRGVAQADRLQERSGAVQRLRARRRVARARSRLSRAPSLATALVGIGGMGGLNPVDLSKMLAGKIAQASPTIGTYTQGISGSATPQRSRDRAAAELPGLHRAEPDAAMRSSCSSAAWPARSQNQAQNPRAVFGEKVEQVNTSNHYSATALTTADVPNLNLEAMQRVLPRALRQRRRLHLLLRRRVHGGRDHAAARAVGGVAAVDRQEDLGLPRHGRAFPADGRRRTK